MVLNNMELFQVLSFKVTLIRLILRSFSEEFFQAVNFGGGAVQSLQKMKQKYPNHPLYVSEYWTGWFDKWNEAHHTRSIQSYTQELENIVLKMNSSINFYMFIGGTNFGWNPGHDITTSYDYDAPLTESGQSCLM